MGVQALASDKAWISTLAKLPSPPSAIPELLGNLSHHLPVMVGPLVTILATVALVVCLGEAKLAPS